MLVALWLRIRGRQQSKTLRFDGTIVLVSCIGPILHRDSALPLFAFHRAASKAEPTAASCEGRHPKAEEREAVITGSSDSLRAVIALLFVLLGRTSCRLALVGFGDGEWRRDKKISALDLGARGHDEATE